MYLGVSSGFISKLIIILMMFISPFILLAFEGQKQIPIKNKPGLSLEETFNLYVRSIQKSDLEGLFSTVTEDEEFFFLTAGGKLIDTREQYYKFHEEWFKGENWDMPVDLIDVYEAKDYGYTLAIFHYRDKSPSAGMRILDSYFTLIFHKENNMWKVIGDICTPVNRYTTEENLEIKYDEKQEYLFDIIRNRRTVRRFKSTPIPKEHIIKILNAARFAPTSGNQQPWKFLVISDREKLNKLKEKAFLWYIEKYKEKVNPTKEDIEIVSDAVKNSLEGALSAPVYIAVLVDSKEKYPEYVIYDGTLAAGYLMIAARALGYGTGFFTSFFPEDKMKEFFNIPKQYNLICFTPIAVPLKWPEVPPKKELKDLIIFESF